MRLSDHVRCLINDINLSRDDRREVTDYIINDDLQAIMCIFTQIFLSFLPFYHNIGLNMLVLLQ